jgi:hypothetical protein
MSDVYDKWKRECEAKNDRYAEKRRLLRDEWFVRNSRYTKEGLKQLEEEIEHAAREAKIQSDKHG